MSSNTALLIDFGSTYTKLRAVDLDSGCVLGAGQGPSTVASDVNVGLDAALADLERGLGVLPTFKHRLASSSAAGGLAMITVGLVKELTAEAARLAALGAGAKLIESHAYKLTDKDARSIVAKAPDILLLAGGTDGGNEDAARWNADKLAAAGLSCPVVIACNRVCADDICETFVSAGIDARVTGNVMPEFNLLDVEPARAAIRDIFIERIVHAKGIDKAEARFDAVLMPTPAAVVEGARLLAEGTDDIAGLGPLVVVDVGGATTDVHSITDGAPSEGGVVTYGLPEPYAKRTVEGDLGMRHNARGIAEAAGLDALARKAGLSIETATEILRRIQDDVERLPENDTEAAFDRVLARAAVGIAVSRHAGRIEIQQAVTGPVTVQYGKDLTAVGTVIGTGGVLMHGSDPGGVLDAALFDSAAPHILKPKSPKLLIDSAYALYAVGLLATVDSAAALRLGLKHLTSVSRTEEDQRHDRSPAA